MSEEIDRRIAIEIFGEEEPPEPDELSLAAIRDRWRNGEPAYSKGKAWSYRVSRAQWGWWPLRFSSSLEGALRAVGKYTSDLGTNTVLFMEYLCDIDGNYQQPFTAGLLGEAARGQTLPEAICKVLLALKEKK